MDLTFSDYVKRITNKATNTQEIAISKPIEQGKEETIEEVASRANKSVWTAKIVAGAKYLMFNGKYVNIDKLKFELVELYKANGYGGYGFSKLSEAELIRYKKVKDSILPLFYDSTQPTEIDAETMAQYLYNDEVIGYEWRPQKVK